LGKDYNSEKNQRLVPRVPNDAFGELNGQPIAPDVFWGRLALGDQVLEHGHNFFNSISYSATATFDVASIQSSTSVGLQYNTYQRENATLYGEIFPAPGLTTISAAAITRGDESWLENKTLGTYIQQQLGMRDQRLFLTAAVRGDDNSAFGAEFDAALYPKLSATWVISDEPFWGVDFFSQLRLRAAWGKAGRQPGVFDAVTLFDPETGPGGVPTVRMGNLGNPDLKPEVSDELELGCDASLLEDRLRVEDGERGRGQALGGRAGRERLFHRASAARPQCVRERVPHEEQDPGSGRGSA
jgi:outer membrane receptor protein involved in Fe transport